MNQSLARLALLIAAAASPVVAVAQKAPHPAPATQKTDVPPRDRLLPEINFNGNSLGDTLDFLRDVTGFQVVLVRPQGMDPANDPTVTLRLRNASFGQVLEVLKQECPIEVSTVAPTKTGESEVTVVRIVGSAKPSAGTDAGMAVRVYHLASIVASLRPAVSPESMLPKEFFAPPGAGGPAPTEQLMAAQHAALEKAAADANAATEKGRKEALNDLLSLCKAALDQVGGNHPTTLQVHEATQTLIFKGAPEQQAALEDVLNSLDPNRGEADKAVVRPRRDDAAAAAIRRAQDDQARERSDLQAKLDEAAIRAEDRLRELRERNDELTARLAKQQAEALQEERDMERLKVRLDAAESKGKDSPKKD